ncbi:ATP-binding protein [Streptomyces sp. NPDC017448]|uniref:ATP-binding protein n=1 Tax=Streptomyces sp. NPDC017448 TaxID=3364996 RepID=UPI00379F1B75
MSPVTAQDYARTVRTAPQALREVRLEVARYLGSQGLEKITDDVLLIVTELLSNVYKHVHDKESLVRIIVRGASCRISVSDSSWDTPSVRTPSLENLDGRGMFLVSQLDPHWMVEITNHGKRIVCSVPVPGLTVRSGLGQW